MAAYVEILLYHGLDATGSLEISDVSDVGPWTKITLTSTKRIKEALAEWQSLANAALPTRTWSFGLDTDSDLGLELSASGGNAWIKISPCLAWLFGFEQAGYSPATVLAAHTSPSGAKGAGYFRSRTESLDDKFAMGVSFPLVAEESELSVYRGGRAASLHYGRALEVDVDFYVMPPEPGEVSLWSLSGDSPLLSGHAAFYLVQDSESPLADGILDGALTLWPLDPGSIERDSDEDPVWIRLRCTVEEST